MPFVGLPLAKPLTMVTGGNLTKVDRSAEKQASRLSGGPAGAAAIIYDMLAKSKPVENIRTFYASPSVPLDDFVKLVPRDRWIIDVGCGLGGFTDHFRQQGFEACGFDISEQAIEKAKQAYPQSSFIVQNATQIFDVFPFAIGAVFDHLSLQNLPKPDIAAIFAVIHKSLPPGGILQTSFEETNDPQQTGWYTVPASQQVEDANGNLNSLVYFIYLSYFEQPELEEMLTDSGFTILKSTLHSEAGLTSGNVVTVLCQK
jgi:SAM-dependent methyltransferase